MIEKQDLGIPLGAGSCGNVTVHVLEEDSFSTFRHFFGDPCQPGDVDTIALIRCTGYKLPQEYNLFFCFLNRKMIIFCPPENPFHLYEFMEVCGKKCFW